MKTLFKLIYKLPYLFLIAIFFVLFIMKITGGFYLYSEYDMPSFYFSLLFTGVFTAFFIIISCTVLKKVFEYKYTVFVICICGLVLRVFTVKLFYKLTPIDDFKNYNNIASELISKAVSFFGTKLLVFQIVLWLIIILAIMFFLYKTNFLYKKKGSVLNFRQKQALVYMIPFLFFILAVLSVIFTSRDNILKDVKQIQASAYISVYPHFIGYPSILALCSLLVGNMISLVSLAQILNIFLSLIISIFIYFTVKNFKGKKYACIAAALWTFWPSQIFYCAMPSAELPFIFMLAATLFFISICEKYEFLSTDYKLNAVAAVAFCAIASFIRPFGVIMLVAFLLYMIIKFIDCRFNIKPVKVQWKKTFFALISCVIVYFGITYVAKAYTAYSTGRKPASSPTGWTLLVGLNQKFTGRWNGEDSLLFAPLFADVKDGTITPDQLHKELMNMAGERFTQNGIKGNTSLFLKKIYYMWYEDELGFTYPYMMKQSLSLSKGIFNFVRGLCTGYYLAGLILLIYALVNGLKRKGIDFSFIVALYILGTIFVHMIMEQGERYTFPVIFQICILTGMLLPKENKKDAEDATCLVI